MFEKVSLILERTVGDVCPYGVGANKVGGECFVGGRACGGLQISIKISNFYEQGSFLFAICTKNIKINCANRRIIAIMTKKY